MLGWHGGRVNPNCREIRATISRPRWPCMSALSAAVLLFLVMDPVGNIPLFISSLKTVSPERRTRVVARELAIAYFVLVAMLFQGRPVLALLGITESALGIAGGVVLFLIAVRMVFPSSERSLREDVIDEPLVFPLAIPYVAGPSALATVLLMSSSHPERWVEWLTALTAWARVAAVEPYAIYERAAPLLLAPIAASATIFAARVVLDSRRLAVTAVVVAALFWTSGGMFPALTRLPEDKLLAAIVIAPVVWALVVGAVDAPRGSGGAVARVIVVAAAAIALATTHPLVFGISLLFVIRRPPRSTLFPRTTLARSELELGRHGAPVAGGRWPAGGRAHATRAEGRGRGVQRRRAAHSELERGRPRASRALAQRSHRGVPRVHDRWRLLSRRSAGPRS